MLLHVLPPTYLKHCDATKFRCCKLKQHVASSWTGVYFFQHFFSTCNNKFCCGWQCLRWMIIRTTEPALFNLQRMQQCYVASWSNLLLVLLHLKCAINYILSLKDTRIYRYFKKFHLGCRQPTVNPKYIICNKISLHPRPHSKTHSLPLYANILKIWYHWLIIEASRVAIIWVKRAKLLHIYTSYHTQWAVKRIYTYSITDNTEGTFKLFFKDYFLYFPVPSLLMLQKFGRSRNSSGRNRISLIFHCNFLFSKTFTRVSITGNYFLFFAVTSPENNGPIFAMLIN